jgi:hypothetical protein
MRRFKIPRAAKISMGSLLGLAAVLFALVAFAHTKAGRPLLAMMGRHGGAKVGCPLGYDVTATPQQRESARQRFALLHPGEGIATGRPALGFTLDVTTRADVLAWASSHGVTCQKPKGGADLDCTDVPSDALPEELRGVSLRSLWLDFGARETLISVVAVRRDASAKAISAAFGAVTLDLAKEAGPPSSVDGEGSATRLSSGLLQQASAEYRFRNYYALTRATNMGDAFVLTEEYRSLPN